MRHFFRLNVKGDGYVLYTGTSVGQFSPQPLGDESDEVPGSFLEAQRRIDLAVKGSVTGWSLAVHHPGHGQSAVLAYGSRIDAPDEFGRRGLSFIHGVELGKPEEIKAAVVGVLSLVAGRKGEALVHEVANVAVGGTPPKLREFFRGLARSLESVSQAASQDNRVGQQLISSVLHDCGGAAATAWLTLAEQQATREPPWSFFDTTEKNGQVITKVEPSAGETTSASRLLLDVSFAKPRAGNVRRPRLINLGAGVVLLFAFGTILWQMAEIAHYKAEIKEQVSQLAQYKADVEVYRQLKGNSGETSKVNASQPVPRTADHPGEDPKVNTSQTEVIELIRAGCLADFSVTLLHQNAYVEAERLLRECLTAYEKLTPGMWITFNTKSLLGAALLGQSKYSEAEPLLLEAYKGMKQLEKPILPHACTLWDSIRGYVCQIKQVRLTETADRLVELYTAWNRPDDVKKWQEERAIHRVITPTPREKK